MMKPEPLKGKICYATSIVMKDTEDVEYNLKGDIPFLIPKRVKSAVEWLIREMETEGEPSNVVGSTRKDIDLEIAIINIKKAFEDVIDS